jgi:NADH-quinone oxidoreductase subunit C
LADATTAPPESEEAPVLAERELGMLARLQQQLGDGILEHGAAFGGLIVRIAPGSWRQAAHFCKDQLGCDYLSFIAAIDWMPTPVIAEEGSGDTSAPVQPKEMTFGVGGSDGRLQVFAHVESTHQAGSGITLKVDVDDADPHAESWVPVYPGADWHERETWEMFGIVFDGHPSLRHLYLPSEFEGHPLRKDFPLLAREVKPWPGLVDVEPMPGEATPDDAPSEGTAIEAGAEAEGGAAE